MPERMTTEKLREWLEEMEPAEIRAKYGELLRNSPESEAILRAYERLDEDLALLKSSEPDAGVLRFHDLADLERAKEVEHLASLKHRRMRLRGLAWMATAAACLILGLLLNPLGDPLPTREEMSAVETAPQMASTLEAETEMEMDMDEKGSFSTRGETEPSAAPPFKVLEAPAQPEQAHQRTFSERLSQAKSFPMPAEPAGPAAEASQPPAAKQVPLPYQAARRSEASSPVASKERQALADSAPSVQPPAEIQDVTQLVQESSGGSAPASPNKAARSAAGSPSINFAAEPAPPAQATRSAMLDSWLDQLLQMSEAMKMGMDYTSPPFANLAFIHWRFLGKEPVSAESFAARMKFRISSEGKNLQLKAEPAGTRGYVLSWRLEEKGDWRRDLIELDEQGACISWEPAD